MLAVHISHAAGSLETLQCPTPCFLTGGDHLEVRVADRGMNYFQECHGPRQERHFTVLETESACQISFTSLDGPGTALLGPFERLKVENGVIRYGVMPERLLAQYDPAGQAWYVYANHQCYTAAVLQPASGL